MATARESNRKKGRPEDPHAGYRRIAADLRHRLESGEWAPLALFPSGRSLARQYRVAENTVRLAIQVLRSEGWLRGSARHRLVVSPAGRGWPQNNALLLEIVANNLNRVLDHKDSAEIQRGIELGAGERNLPLVILHHGHLADAFPLRFLDLPSKGVILFGLFQKETLRQYAELKLPVVLVDQPSSLPLHRACVDNESACADAVHRLVNLGHRNLAFVRFVPYTIRDLDPDSKERQRGFFNACRRAGLSRNAAKIVNAFPTDTPNAPAIRDLFTTRPEITAVLTTDLERARLLQNAAKLYGKRIPKDLSLLCFQGQRDADAFFGGPRIDFLRMGREAVYLLEEPPYPPLATLVPAGWKDGASLGPAPFK